MSTDPYAAPKSHVADVPAAGADARFIPEGQAVATGNGWSWISAARRLTKEQSGLWIGIFITFVLIVIVLNVLPRIGPLILYFVAPILFGGIILGCDAAYKGERATFGHLFAGFRSHAGKLLGIGAATFLAYVAIFAIVAVIFGASVSMVMMGIHKPDPANPLLGLSALLAVLVMLALSVPIYMAAWFSYALVTINDFGVFQALKASFFACLKNILPFLVYGVMMFLLMIVASIPLFLGWLILGPVLFASFYTSYRDVFYSS